MPTINKEELRAKFQEFFGVTPHNFQLEVAQNLLEGKSVVLQAPTGAGKTFTALFPFLYAWKYLEPQDFPRKSIYSVERKILVNNFHADVEERLTKLDLNLKPGILTGDRAEDRSLEKNLIFTTIDQTLSSFLFTPYSLSSRQANLNAGAISSSYLVFDEAHLFDSKTALPTLMWILQALKGITPSLLMTATFSKPVLEKLAEITGGKIVTVSAKELESIPAQATKKRYFQTVATPLTGEAVWEKHNQRSIVVCNTVDRAQQLYDELETLAKGTDTKLILLHARFWQTDRKQKEADLLKLFGKNNKLEVGSAILIATQVIEVGVDITCKNLHTELAPANTILQRAGRCARYENEVGTVFVYQVESKLPYAKNDDVEAIDLFQPTFDNLNELGQGGTLPVTFELEQELINRVHTVEDTKTLAAIEANRDIHGREIEITINQQEKGYLSNLIRDADSRTILVHDEPDLIESPYAYEGFSIFDGSFRGKLKGLRQEADQQSTWAVKYPKEIVEDAEKKEQIERRKVRYEWPILNPDDKNIWQPVVVVNPALVSYDKERGFRFIPNQGEPFRSKPLDKARPEREKYGYKLETYAEHIRNVNWAYGHFKFADEIAFACSRLQERLGSGVPTDTIDRAVRLSFVFHDAGKLTEGWQKSVHDWQSAIGNAQSANFMIAHTNYDPILPQHRELNKSGKYRRPPHAVEGAAIVVPYLYKELGKELYRPVVSAIASHHAPGATMLGDYKLHSSAAQALNEAMTHIAQGQPWNMEAKILTPARPPNMNELDSRLMVKAKVQPDNQLDLLLYMLIIRVLRLADQKSFEFGKVHSEGN